MAEDALCTLDELAELVERALAVDYPGVPTGRVRDVPDQRAIRWYVTRGLVDRPAASRGRVALYGRRHLLQLVAIKRRQADGASLAQIQAELAGATDDTLASVAKLADIPPLPPTPPRSGVDRRPDPEAPFWARRPAASRPTTSDSAPLAGTTSSRSTRAGDMAQAEPSITAGDLSSSGSLPGAVGPRPESVALRGIRLAPGITLLIEDGAAALPDLAAIQAAARPLLGLLVPPVPGPSQDAGAPAARAPAPGGQTHVPPHSPHPDEE